MSTKPANHAPVPPVVLIIEDDGTVADAVAMGLTEEGMCVTVARDGLEGDARLEGGGWGVVVLDWMLPGIDGFALLDRFRARDPITPVLLLTARDAVGDRVLGLQAGADDYLCKPFAFDELVARVRALLRRTAIAEDWPNRVPRRDRRSDLSEGMAGRAGDDAGWAGVRSSRVFPATPRPTPLATTTVRGRVARTVRPSPRNLDVHLAELRRHLEAYGSRIIHTARGYGYRISEHPGERDRL